MNNKKRFSSCDVSVVYVSARGPVPDDGRVRHPLRVAAVRRARRLQVARALLAPQARAQLLEDAGHDVLEPGIRPHTATTSMSPLSYNKNDFKGIV